MGNKNTIVQVAKIEPISGQLGTVYNPEKGLYRYDDIFLDYTKNKCYDINSNTISNIHLHKYKTLLNREIPCFILVDSGICYTYFIKSNTLYLSGIEVDENDSEYFTLNDLIRDSRILFGDGEFDVDMEMNTRINPNIVR